MNVLLIGSGGREHALAWALSRSDTLTQLFCAPGNPGMEEAGTLVGLDTTDHIATIAFCRKHNIDLVVVGPEAPLVDGLCDSLEDAQIACFGPSKLAAQLEGSKGFTKDLCKDFNIPTAGYGRFDDAATAKAYVDTQSLPIVIKADGLAAGKGVIIAQDKKEAHAAIDACFTGAFGEAGHEVVVEEFLEGEEASFFALVDGTHALALATAQDHKRVGDGDVGPNTGGMGAYSPAPVMTDALNQRVMEQIIMPTVRGMAARGCPYKGVLYAGLMITKNGPQLIEYNVRFGDPECQVLTMRLKSDLLALLKATADGRLDGVDVEWRKETALTVVMAANGYPGPPVKGSDIRGVEAAEAPDSVKIFHAGTRRDGDRLIANGGRVLNVTALGATVREAKARAYDAVAKIDWPGGFCRSDIGWRAVERESIE